MNIKIFLPLYTHCGTLDSYKTFEAEVIRSSWKHLKNDRLKSWKYLTTCSRPCNSFESGIVNIYKTTSKKLFALVSYYDGSFYLLVAYVKLPTEALKLIEDNRSKKRY